MPSETTLSGRPDCIALTDALALALAVAIDPLVFTRPPKSQDEVAEAAPIPRAEMPPELPKVAPMPEVPALQARPVASGSKAQPLLSFHAVGGLDLGTIPAGWSSISVGSRLSIGALGLELEPFFVLPGAAALSPHGEVNSWATGGTAAACWLWKALGLCGALRGGAIRYRAYDIANAQSGMVGFLAAGARASVLIPLSSEAIALRLQGELWLPLARAAMVVSNDIVWRQFLMGQLQAGVDFNVL